MNNKIIKIGVIGIGTVGAALINHLKANKKVIQANKIADHTVFVSKFIKLFWQNKGLN